MPAEIQLVELTCQRCGKVWVPRISKPRSCPNIKCHSIYWDRPLKTKANGQKEIPMVKRRQIVPAIWTNKQFISLVEPGARLLYIGMISNADDEGRMEASPQFLKATVFAGDSITLPKILQWRTQIVTAELITIYKINGIEYLSLPTWKKYQYITQPLLSQIPAPPAPTNGGSPEKVLPVKNIT